MNKFVRKYSVSKTLRFELKPVGETAEKINDFKNQAIISVVKQDEQRAKEHKQIKSIIDNYHRCFIDQVLEQQILIDTDIQTAFKCYIDFKSSNDENNREQYQDKQDALRKKISKAFTNQSKEHGLFDANLINEKGSGDNKTMPLLWHWLKGQLDSNKISSEEFEKSEILIKHFDKFYTYFTRFSQNRKNIYSHEEHRSSISYRLVNENMVTHGCVHLTV